MLNMCRNIMYEIDNVYTMKKLLTFALRNDFLTVLATSFFAFSFMRTWKTKMNTPWRLLSTANTMLSHSAPEEK